MDRTNALYLAAMVAHIETLHDIRKDIDNRISGMLEELGSEAWFGEEYEQIKYPEDIRNLRDTILDPYIHPMD
jgi:hypothetical protein